MRPRPADEVAADDEAEEPADDEAPDDSLTDDQPEEAAEEVETAVDETESGSDHDGAIGVDELEATADTSDLSAAAVPGTRHGTRRHRQDPGDGRRRVAAYARPRRGTRAGDGGEYGRNRHHLRRAALACGRAARDDGGARSGARADAVPAQRGRVVLLGPVRPGDETGRLSSGGSTRQHGDGRAGQAADRLR